MQRTIVISLLFLSLVASVAAQQTSKTTSSPQYQVIIPIPANAREAFEFYPAASKIKSWLDSLSALAMQQVGSPKKQAADQKDMFGLTEEDHAKMEKMSEKEAMQYVMKKTGKTEAELKAMAAQMKQETSVKMQTKTNEKYELPDNVDDMDDKQLMVYNLKKFGLTDLSKEEVDKIYNMGDDERTKYLLELKAKKTGNAYYKQAAEGVQQEINEKQELEKKHAWKQTQTQCLFAISQSELSAESISFNSLGEEIRNEMKDEVSAFLMKLEDDKKLKEEIKGAVDKKVAAKELKDYGELGYSIRANEEGPGCIAIKNKYLLKILALYDTELKRMQTETQVLMNKECSIDIRTLDGQLYKYFYGIKQFVNPYDYKSLLNVSVFNDLSLRIMLQAYEVMQEYNSLKSGQSGLLKEYPDYIVNPG